MAYNPGVQPIGGQLLGQGILQAAQSISQGIQQRQQKAEQNKVFSAQSKATENLLKSFLPKEQADTILALDPNESPAARHARLVGTIENFVVENKMKEQQNDKAQINELFARFQQTGDLKSALGGYRGSPQALQQVGPILEKFLTQVPQRPVMDLKSYRGTDEKGKPIEITVDELTGKEVGRGPLQGQPEIPNPINEKIYADLSTERKDLVMPAIKTLGAYDEIDRILSKADSGFISGALAKPELFVKRIANVIGADLSGVENTQVVRSLFAVPVAQIIKNFGAGTGLSDADREFAAAAAGGDITLDEGAIKKLVRIGKEVSKNIRKDYEERLDTTFPKDSDNAIDRKARQALQLPANRTVQEADQIDSLVNKYLNGNP